MGGGKASTNVAGWGISAKAERDMDNEDADLSVRMVASAGDGFSVNRVEATKGLDIDGARVTVNPRYDMGSEEADVVVSYDNGSTNVQLTASAESQEVSATHDMGDTVIGVTASADSQEITVRQQLDDNNSVAPTINNSGDLSVA